MAKWLVNTMTKHYVKTIPVETAIGRAGFKPGEKVDLPRAHHDPPEELIKYLIPDVDKWDERRRQSLDDIIIDEQQ
jgi:hypothetical protein